MRESFVYMNGDGVGCMKGENEGFIEGLHYVRENKCVYWC